MRKLAAILVLIALPWLVWQNYSLVNKAAAATAQHDIDLLGASIAIATESKRADDNELELDSAIGLSWYLATKASLERYRAERCEYQRDGAI